jgi:hypothetical protein
VNLLNWASGRFRHHAMLGMMPVTPGDLIQFQKPPLCSIPWFSATIWIFSEYDKSKRGCCLKKPSHELKSHVGKINE